MSTSSTHNKSLVPTNGDDRRPVYLHLDPNMDPSNDAGDAWATETLARLHSLSSDPSDKGFKLDRQHGYSVLTCNNCDHTHVLLKNELNTEDIEHLDSMINGTQTPSHVGGDTTPERANLEKIIEALRTENEKLKRGQSVELMSRPKQEVKYIKFKNDYEEDDDTIGADCLDYSQAWLYDITEKDAEALSSCGLCGAFVVSSVFLLAVGGVTGVGGASYA